MEQLMTKSRLFAFSALLTSTLLLSSLGVHAAAKADLIQITADEQSFDLQNNKATFSGNVIVTRGSMRLTAAKAIITQTNNGKQQVIEAYGSPVKFSSVLSNGKQVNGQGQKLRYETAQKRITLIGNAYLKQQDSSIHSDTITYLIDQQQMKASGSKKSRVSTVLMPAQLQN